jgi:hypothetical protein
LDQKSSLLKVALDIVSEIEDEYEDDDEIEVLR